MRSSIISLFYRHKVFGINDIIDIIGIIDKKAIIPINTINIINTAFSLVRTKMILMVLPREKKR